MGLGPSPVLSVRRYDLRLALRGPWTGGLTAVQLATAPVFNGRVSPCHAMPALVLRVVGTLEAIRTAQWSTFNPMTAYGTDRAS